MFALGRCSGIASTMVGAQTGSLVLGTASWAGLRREECLGNSDFARLAQLGSHGALVHTYPLTIVAGMSAESQAASAPPSGAPL